MAHRVSGPIIATFTINDKAVGVAYPIASRLADQNARALGDANDPFGGLGHNGAPHLQDSEIAAPTKLLAATENYVFAKAKVTNLLADDYVKNHGDVRNPES